MTLAKRLLGDDFSALLSGSETRVTPEAVLRLKDAAHSVRPPGGAQINFLITTRSASLSAILCSCDTIHTSYIHQLIRLRPQSGESLARVQRCLPRALFCPTHQIFIVSLCLSKIITASPMIGHTVMDVWRFCFRGFYCSAALFIITPALRLKEAGMKLHVILFFFFFLLLLGENRSKEPLSDQALPLNRII